jgi:hypothetical protein
MEKLEVTGRSNGPVNFGRLKSTKGRPNQLSGLAGEREELDGKVNRAANGDG